MANPFFTNAAPQARAAAAPLRGGKLSSIGKMATYVLGAKQAYDQIIASGGDAGKVMSAVLSTPAFKDYKGPRDPQSMVEYGCKVCGLNIDDVMGYARQYGIM